MPYSFISVYLQSLEPCIKVMFGNRVFYIGDKIYLATRDNMNDPKDNGLWIGTCLEHHESLKSQFPSLVHLKAKNVKKWLLLPSTDDNFKSVAMQICDLIKNDDPRIGVAIKR